MLGRQKAQSRNAEQATDSADASGETTSDAVPAPTGAAIEEGESAAVAPETDATAATAEEEATAAPSSQREQEEGRKEDEEPPVKKAMSLVKQKALAAKAVRAAKAPPTP